MSKQAIDLVWEIVKFTISECAQILKNMHMDHIIICSIYAVCKKFKIEISFSKIFKKYQKLAYIKTDINQKNIKDDEENNLINLKEFYNKRFLNKTTRGFITAQAEKYIQSINQGGKGQPITVKRVSQSSFRYTEGKYFNKGVLKKMNLDSPLYETIPNIIPSSESSVIFLYLIS